MRAIRISGMEHLTALRLIMKHAVILGLEKEQNDNRKGACNVSAAAEIQLCSYRLVKKYSNLCLSIK